MIREQLEVSCGRPDRGGPLCHRMEVAFPVREWGDWGRSSELTCILKGRGSRTGRGQGLGLESSWGPGDLTGLDRELLVEVKAVPTKRGFS